MTDILDQLLRHRSTTPMQNEKLMDRAAEEIMRMRSLIFEMLAALSWLKENGIVSDPLKFERIEQEAREVLQIDMKDSAPVIVTSAGELRVEPVDFIQIEPPKSDDLLPTYKICPHCGDRNPKTVHLRRRPPVLECQTCRRTYAWPHRWM